MKMFRIDFLTALLRTHIPKRYQLISHISSKECDNQNIRSAMFSQTEIEQSNDTLNPDISELLCALCTPGTESAYIKENIIKEESFEKRIPRNKSIGQISTLGGQQPHKRALFFDHKIRTVHVTYVEPTIQNIPQPIC